MAEANVDWFTTSYDKYQNSVSCHLDHNHLGELAFPGFSREIKPVNDVPDEEINKDLLKIVLDHIGRLGLTADFMTGQSDTLYRCISREIYGIEDHYGMVIMKLQDGKKQTPKEIQEDLKERNPDGVKLLFTEFPCEDTQRSLEEIANAFNMPIYVHVHAFDGNVVWLPFYPEPKVVGSETPSYCSFYLTFLYLDGKFHRICPKLQGKCRCEYTRPTCEGLIPFIRQCLQNSGLGIQDDTYKKLEDCLDKVNKGINELRKRFDDIQEVTTMVTDALEQTADVLDKRRKAVNITVLSAQSVSIATGIGSAVAFILLTVGGLATLPILITMVSVGVASSLTTGGAKIVKVVGEKVKKEEAEQDLRKYQKFCMGFQDIAAFIDAGLTEMYKILRGTPQSSAMPRFSSNVTSSAASMAAVALRTAKSVPVIALMALRTAASTGDVVVAVLAPLTLILDVAILVSTAVDTHRGSKSKLAADLRNISKELKIRQRLFYWMFSKYRTSLEGNV